MIERSLLKQDDDGWNEFVSFEWRKELVQKKDELGSEVLINENRCQC